ncbi:hypothetical protein GOB57_20990 [Sinorhizobium meliloti]|nr:hypothetical protein [Sinorhizobium meliloti]
MWMNRDDIDRMVLVGETEVPEILPFATFLADWRDTVDENSDGWSTWRAGSKCADRLMGLLQEADNSRRGRGHVPPRELFLRALTPIKSFATQRGLPRPELVEGRPAAAPHALGTRI